MSSLQELQANVWRYLGTTSSDPAFPASGVTSALNNALHSLYADALQEQPDSFAKIATLSAADSTSRQYQLAGQTQPITDFAGVLEVRHTNEDGLELRDVPYSDRLKVSFQGYSVIGADQAASLVTTPATAPGIPLYLTYRYWPTMLSAPADEPQWLPPQFHDIPALMAAEEAYAQGGEQAFPVTYAARLNDRMAQLRLHWSRRSRGPKIRRDA